MLKVLFEVGVGTVIGCLSIFAYGLICVVFLITVELLLMIFLSVTCVRMILRQEVLEDEKVGVYWDNYVVYKS